MLADPRIKESQLLTRDVHVNQYGQVLIALDALGHRHLLVTDDAAVDPAKALDVTDNLGLTSRQHEGTGYIDLACRDDSLGLVFERLCADVVTRARNEPTITPRHALVQALDDWQTLFQRSPSPLSREEHIGLYGELLVMERLAHIDPVGALSSWTGPAKSLRDFSSERAFIEVKCTTSQDAKRITVSSLDQLDPAAGDPLFLVLVSLTPDTTGDSTQVVIERLVAAGVPRHALERKVAQYGYSFSTSEDPKFSVKSMTFWEVQEESPGLRRSDVPPERINGVEKVKYTLAVESLGDSMAADEIENVLTICAS